jgi:hypothetical protein
VKALDRRLVVAGAVSGLFFALPAAVLQRTVFDGSAWAGAMLAVVTREVPNPIGIVFAGLLFASLGTIGAYVAVWGSASGRPGGAAQ